MKTIWLPSKFSIMGGIIPRQSNFTCQNEILILSNYSK